MGLLKWRLTGTGVGDPANNANRGDRHPIRGAPHFRLRGTITDDTQMTMRLAESILRASREPHRTQRSEGRGLLEPNHRRAC